MRISPPVRVSAYRDGFGNWCSRLLAPQGQMLISADAVISDSGLPETIQYDAGQVPVEQLPEECIVFLLASRFCDSDRLLDLAWQLFGHAQPGAPRVQAICDFVHQRIAFDYNDASVTRTASEAYREGRGVCRDYAHLAIAFLPGDEHPGALLHLLSRRCRHAAALSARRFRGLVRGLSRQWLADVRPAQQRAADRPGADRARARRGRCRHRHDLRPEYARPASRSGPTRSSRPEAQPPG